MEKQFVSVESERFGRLRLEMLSQQPQGQARRFPLLFVHGSFHGAWCWAEHFMPFFSAEGYPCYALNLRGHGESGGRELLDDFTLEDYVEDVKAAVAALEEPPVLVGHSYGGAVVQKYLERTPPGCRAAVLVTPPPPRGAHRAAIMRSLRHPLLFARLAPFIAKGEPPPPARLFFSRRYDREKGDSHMRRLQRQSARVMSEFKNFEVGRPAGVPVLVLGAGRDLFTSAKSLGETARFHGGQLEQIPESGHNIMLDDQWQAAAAVMLRWLSRLEV